MSIELDLRHWMNGGTGLTNFRREQYPLYEAALEKCGDERFFIISKPMSGNPNAVPTDYSLHRKGQGPADAFWRAMEQIEAGELV